MKCNSKLSTGIAIHSRRQINRHFPAGHLIQFSDQITVFTLYFSGQSNAENGIYYSSIFLTMQVIHNRHLIICSNLALSLHFFRPVIRISCQINCALTVVLMQDTRNSHTIPAIISTSADAQDLLLFILTCKSFFQFFYNFQSRPLHKHTGRYSHPLNRVTVTGFHFLAGHYLFHPVTSCL